MSREEFRRIMAEQRDEASQRPLHEKGVRYEDDLSTERLGGKAKPPEADAVKDFIEQLAAVRPVTRNLIESILMDVWPRNAAIVDFGIDSQQHYEALYYPIRASEIMPEALDAALGHGEKLTAMTQQSPSNPHKDVDFHTSWDVMFGRGSKESPTAAQESLQNILGVKPEAAASEPARENDHGIER